MVRILTVCVWFIGGGGAVGAGVHLFRTKTNTYENLLSTGKNTFYKNLREFCFALKPNLEGGMRQSLFKTKHSIKGEALRIIHTKLFKEIMHRINEMILQNDLLNCKRYKFD